MAELTPGLPTQPPGHGWVPVSQSGIAHWGNLIPENPDLQMAPTAMQQQQGRSWKKAEAKPEASSYRDSAPLAGTPASTRAQIKMTH